MSRYPEERKNAVLKKLLPPMSMSVPKLAKQEGISEATLYNWRNQIRETGSPVPNSGQSPEQWSPEVKFAVVVETASLSEIELGEYCRSKGLYPEQIVQWREACINGTASAKSSDKEAQAKLKAERRKTKQLEKELRRKDKALAETTALLVLRKKFDALWEDDEVD